MTKPELFKKYNINETHNQWIDIDDWCSVEIYRLMHNGELPPPDDLSIKWVTEFLDKASSDIPWWTENVMCRRDWGSLFMTAKRMVYMFSEQLL